MQILHPRISNLSGGSIMKTRKDCFFGLHFDFHAMEGEAIGSIIDIESIEKMLDATKPDMIQVDTKGHPGISSYMTKAGVHAEVMHMDTLKVWRELTAKRGIRLYAHHSGLFDISQSKLHPEWRSLKADGEANGGWENGGYMSVFSPYVDEVLIPQIKEIAGIYKADGVWVDGDEWGAHIDYSPWAKNAWLKETGKDAPLPEEEGYDDYVEFCREGFRRYVAHYIAVVKAEFPHFEITSNWMYSHAMPEKRTVPIDFISGDYSSANSVRSARDLGRCIVNQDITWDLMAWGQNAKPESWLTRDRCTKEPEQLCQEAAVILALGGGFQFFNILYGTGGIVQRWAIDGWAEVAKFCRARQKYCFNAKSIADIGVIYPKYYAKNRLFTGAAFTRLRSFVSMLADAGFSCDVVNEADIKGLERYKVLLLPSAEKYDSETMEILAEFAKNGGTVIADGGVSFGPEISGATFAEPVTKLVFPDCGGRLSSLETSYYEPTLLTAIPLIDCYDGNYFYEKEKHIGCVLNHYGSGKVVSLCFDLASVYRDNINYALKQFTKKLLRESGYKAFISVTGSDYADLTLTEKNGKIMANVINTAGEHHAVGVRTFGEVPKIGPLDIHIRCENEPKRIMLRPENKKLRLISTDDGFTYRIPSLHIHSIVEIEL